jgi:hypothetical protein
MQRLRGDPVYRYWHDGVASGERGAHFGRDLHKGKDIFNK